MFDKNKTKRAHSKLNVRRNLSVSHTRNKRYKQDKNKSLSQVPSNGNHMTEPSQPTHDLHENYNKTVKEAEESAEIETLPENDNREGSTIKVINKNMHSKPMIHPNTNVSS